MKGGDKNTFVRHGSRDKSFGKGRLRPQASPNFVHLLSQTDIGTSGGKRWPKKQRYDGGSDLYHSGVEKLRAATEGSSQHIDNYLGAMHRRSN